LHDGQMRLTGSNSKNIKSHESKVLKHAVADAVNQQPMQQQYNQQADATATQSGSASRCNNINIIITESVVYSLIC